jgi:hypothetical protein
VEEPHLNNSQFIGRFRSVGACVERFPQDSTEDAQAFADVAAVVDGLRYDGFISSPKNGYQINLTFDHCLIAQLRANSRECISEPVLSAPREVAHAVGRNADAFLRLAHGPMMVIEIEKANEEKILRDIVKMLLFLEAGQAELAALICPRNYVHKGGVWKVFETARQVLRSFVHVTELPTSKARQIALIGCTQEVFMGGGWRVWDKNARSEFLKLARPYFENL